MYTVCSWDYLSPNVNYPIVLENGNSVTQTYRRVGCLTSIFSHLIWLCATDRIYVNSLFYLESSIKTSFARCIVCFCELINKGRQEIRHYQGIKIILDSYPVHFIKRWWYKSVFLKAFTAIIARFNQKQPKRPKYENTQNSKTSKSEIYCCICF